MSETLTTTLGIVWLCCWPIGAPIGAGWFCYLWGRGRIDPVTPTRRLITHINLFFARWDLWRRRMQ